MNQSIGIMTIDAHIYNYGGILQEFALFKFLKDRGDNVEIIDYLQDDELNTFSVKRDIRNISLYQLKAFIKRKRSASRPDITEAVLSRNSGFDKFRKNNMAFSAVINAEQLRNSKLPYDVVVCGSDQIWNPKYNKPAFFLDFATEQKKIIYAASIGRYGLTKRQKQVYAKYLNEFNIISVRELSAKRILSDIFSGEIRYVLDPTFLLPQSFWIDFAESTKIKYTGYVFCYLLNMTVEKIMCVNSFAAQQGLRVLRIPNLQSNNNALMFDNEVDVNNADPIDFLKLIKEADYVITDSFHGTVFSIIYNKPFMVFRREGVDDEMNCRIIELLELVGMTDRFLDPKERKIVFPKSKCDLRSLEIMRQDSMMFINDEIDECNHI